MTMVKGAFGSSNVNSLSMITNGHYGLDGGLTSRTKVFTKSADMMKFDEDEGDGDDDSEGIGGGEDELSKTVQSIVNGDTYHKQRVGNIDGSFADKGGGSYQNVTSLYVHPDEDEIIDELADLESLPGDDEDDDDDLNEETEDIVGPLASPGKVDLLKNNFYPHRHHRLFPQNNQPKGLIQGKTNPLTWALNERPCSLSSDALNQIMVNRGASSASNHSGNSPLSRSSSSSSEKVILLPRLSTQSIKCKQINCTDPDCPNTHLHNLYGLWSDKKLPILPISLSSTTINANNQVSNTDPNVLRLHVNGQTKLSNNQHNQMNKKSTISMISPTAQSKLTNDNQTNGYKRLDTINHGQQSSPSSSSSSSPIGCSSSSTMLTNDSTGYKNLQQLNQQSNGKTTWRHCKNSSEVILVANQMDYNSSMKTIYHQAKSQRKYGSTGIRLTPDQALARYHRQFTCEAVSLIVLIIAVTFLIATPFILIPIFAFPDINQDLIRVIMWLSLLLSIIFTIIGALIGNVYWYYDQSTETFKWRFHFGSGPKHYWGSTLFNFTNNQRQFNHHNHQDRPSSNHNQQFANHLPSSAIVNHV